jgi:lipopolysaccharide/colanic/teichoic acid biosynthesis glycosyltransferase
VSLRPHSIGNNARTAVIMTGDALVATVSLGLALAGLRSLHILVPRFSPPLYDLPLSPSHIAIWSFSLLVALALSGFYDTTASPRHRPSFFVALPLQLALVAVVGTLLVITWPRTLFLAVPLLEGFALAGWRALMSALWPTHAPRTIVVGGPADLLSFVREVERAPRAPLRLDGLVSIDGHVDHPLMIGRLTDPAAQAAIATAPEVIDLGGDDGLRRLLLLALRGPRGFLFAPHVRDSIVAGSRFGVVGSRMLAEVRMRGTYGAGAAAKRVFDLFVGTLLMAATLPLQLLAAAAVVVEGNGPVLLRQPRLGAGGRTFRMWKFRTMHHDEAGDSTRAVDGDRRVTPVGRWLRRYRLDELPQLVNVLAGDMSVVGPRPEIPAVAEAITRELPAFELRLAMKPGIAGLAQVSAEYDQSAETKLTYDLQYLCAWSPLLDARILLQTVTIVLAGRGV